MKSKLKVGDKVWDSALFGDLEGEVYEVGDDFYTFPIRVKFGKQSCAYKIKGNKFDELNPTLSMQPYDKLSEIVPVWEEEEVWGLFWENDDYSKRYGKMTKSNDSIYPYTCNDRLNWRHFKETGKLI